MAKPPSNRRKRRESSSSDGASASAGSSAAAIKADPEENEQAATNGKNTTSAAGLIFKEEVLNRRVQVLFDVDTGKDDEPMAHQWYEGTITAVQLEPANAKAGAGGGKRGGKRGARSKSAGNGSTKLKATHRVEFDDGDVRWFDLVYWTGKGELKWVGEEPTPVSHPTIDPNPNAGNAVGTEEATAATSPQEPMDAAAAASAAPLHVQKDGAGEKASPLVSPNGKRNAPENNGSGSIGGSGEPQASAKKAKVSPPPPESLPHTLIHGKKYYIV